MEYLEWHFIYFTKCLCLLLGGERIAVPDANNRYRLVTEMLKFMDNIYGSVWKLKKNEVIGV